MNSKLFILLLLAMSLSVLFSACTSVESSPSKEVVIDDGGKTSGKEIFINDTDFQKEKPQISTSKESIEEGKRILGDKSEVETLIDGFGNKTETRYFKNNPRLRFIILRTSADGTKVVTVYGYGGDTQMLNDLGDTALTASGDEIADSAKLNATRSYAITPNFMKGSKTETPALQPLPSSQFPIKPVQQIEQTKAEVRSEPSNNDENSVN